MEGIIGGLTMKRAEPLSDGDRGFQETRGHSHLLRD